MGDYGFKTSLPGYDVKTATLQQTGFSSKYPIYKQVFSGQITLSIGTGGPDYVGYSTTFDHNLGYVPSFKAYTLRKDPAGLYAMLDTSDGGGFGLSSVLIHVRATTSQLIFYGENRNAATYSYTISYFIFADPAT